MLAIGIHGLTKADDADLYALVYPSSTGSLSDLYNADPITQDEVDKFLNNQPSKLDQYNKAASEASGLGTRKLYLFRNTQGDVKAMRSTGSNAYIYYDAIANCAKVHCEGYDTFGDAYKNGTLGPVPDYTYKAILIYKKVLNSDTTLNPLPSKIYCSRSDIDTTATSFGASPNSTAFIKIKTSNSTADAGDSCFFNDTTLTLGSTTISGYKMLTTNDYFLTVYQTAS